MTVCNNSVQSNLMQVGCLQLQHLVNTFHIDFIGGVTDLLRCAICTAETSLNELLAILVQQIESGQVRATRDLDQLRKAITDLSCGKGAQEGEVEEGVDGCMICS